jgi:hypothetical protein
MRRMKKSSVVVKMINDEIGEIMWNNVDFERMECRDIQISRIAAESPLTSWIDSQHIH